MTLYGLSQRTLGVVIRTPIWEIRSTSTNKPKILEIGISQTTSSTNFLAIGRSGAVGVNPTNPQNFVDESDGNAPPSQTTGAVAWGTAPTAPSLFLRSFPTTVVAGQGIIFSFPRGLVIPISSSITIWDVFASAGGTCDVYAAIDE